MQYIAVLDNVPEINYFLFIFLQCFLSRLLTDISIKLCSSSMTFPYSCSYLVLKLSIDIISLAIVFCARVSVWFLCKISFLTLSRSLFIVSFSSLDIFKKAYANVEYLYSILTTGLPQQQFWYFHSEWAL
jgi:hypothetical protein